MKQRKTARNGEKQRNKMKQKETERNERDKEK